MQEDHLEYFQEHLMMSQPVQRNPQQAVDIREPRRREGLVCEDQLAVELHASQNQDCLIWVAVSYQITCLAAP